MESQRFPRKIPFLSLIVPVYNCEVYLEQCISSIIQAPGEEVEIILVDDGSADNSAALCDMFANEHDNIQVIHQENQGVSAARNTGISAASGKWICFVDADDFLDNGWYAALKMSVSGIQDSDAVVFHSNARNRIYTKSEIISAVLGYDNTKRLNPAHLCNVCSKIYLRQFILLNNIEFILGVVNGEDMLFNLQVFSKTDSVLFSANSYYYVRKNMISATQKFNPEIAEANSVFHVHLARILREAGLSSPYWEHIRSVSLLNGIFTCYYALTGKTSWSRNEKKELLQSVLNQPENKKVLTLYPELRGDFPVLRKILLTCIYHRKYILAEWYILLYKYAVHIRYRLKPSCCLI